MSLELIFRCLVQTIVNNRNKRNFALIIKAYYKYILDFIDKWNPELKKHNCSITTKIHQFYYGYKQFPKCLNKKCANYIFNMTTFLHGYAKTCSTSCRKEYLKEIMKGENNPNYGHKWTDEQKKIASDNSKRQMCDYLHRYVLNQPKTEASKKSKSLKISQAQRNLAKRCPDAHKNRHHWSKEEKIEIGKKQSIFMNNPKTKQHYRELKEKSGKWIPLSQKSDYDIYFAEAKWIKRMFNLIEDKRQLELLKINGIFNTKTNKNGVVRDHIYSRWSGFLDKVFPEILRHPCNCQLITHSQNISKAHKQKGLQLHRDNEQTLDELFNKILHYDKQWCEQELCVKLINDYKNGKRWKNPYKKDV